MGGCSEGQEIPGYASEDHMIVTIMNTKYFALVAKLLTSLMLPLPLPLFPHHRLLRTQFS